MRRLLDDPQVRVTTHASTDTPPDCDNCDATDAGVNGVHWHAQDEPFGLLNACDTCLAFALATALDDAPTDTDITCERHIHTAVLGVAA